MMGFNPLAFAMMGAAQDPTKWAPLLDAMQAPLPGTPEFMMLTGGQGPGMNPMPDIGGMLGGNFMQPTADTDPNLTPTAPNYVPTLPSTGKRGLDPSTMGVVDPMNPEITPTPPQTPVATPPPGVAPPSLTPTPPTARGPAVPQVRAPEQQRPIMSGGVSGAQKAPDFGGKAALQTPAQMMMAALLNRNADTLRVPSLGAMLRGGRY